MNRPQAPQPRHVRYRVRHQAPLDAATHAKLEELARTFHRKRSAILRSVMPWGLTQTQGWTVEMTVPGTVHTLSMLLEPELLQQLHEAATTYGTSIAAWVRHAMRQVTLEDFPEHWQTGETAIRSHDSRYDGQRFLLRLNETTAKKLQHLVEQFGRPRAGIIRQLITQATTEAFPPSWQLGAQERWEHS